MTYRKAKHIWDHTLANASRQLGDFPDLRAWIAPDLGGLIEEIGPRADLLGLFRDSETQQTIGSGKRVVAVTFAEDCYPLTEINSDADEFDLWMLFAKPFGLESYWESKG